MVVTSGRLKGGQWGLPPPIGLWSWLHEAVFLRHMGEFSFKSLSFGPFCMKMDEKLSVSGGFVPRPPPGALPLDPVGGSAHRPRYRLALHVLAMVHPHFGKSWICRWLLRIGDVIHVARLVTHSFSQGCLLTFIWLMHVFTTNMF